MLEIKNGNKTTYKIKEKESDDEELKDLTTSNRGSMGYTDIDKEEWDRIFKKGNENESN